MLASLDIPCTVVEKRSGPHLSGEDVIDRGEVDLVINVPVEFDEEGRPDGYHIRRRAVDAGVPLITELQLARAVIEALRWRNPDNLEVLAWDEYRVRSSEPLIQ